MTRDDREWTLCNEQSYIGPPLLEDAWHGLTVVPKSRLIEVENELKNYVNLYENSFTSKEPL
jgi:hypothetical protein